MDLLSHLRTLARANRLSNHRLHGACSELTDDAFCLQRTGFFGSLSATLNHVLIVDLYYISALHGEGDMAKAWHDPVPFPRLPELAEAQRASDTRLIAWCDGASARDLEAIVDLDRGARIQRERAGHVLMHLLTHQIHHRGQAHAMLSGTPVAPPQLDEFVMPSEAHLRTADLAALGWTEEDLFGPGGAR